MKRLIKKSDMLFPFKHYDYNLGYETDEVNGIKFEYTLDGGNCSNCGEKVYSDDGSYYVSKDGHKALMCDDCASDYFDKINKENESAI